MEYLFKAGGVCEDTDHEGYPSGLRSREETSGFSSPSNVPVREISDTAILYDGYQTSQSIHMTSELFMLCYACICVWNI